MLIYLHSYHLLKNPYRLSCDIYYDGVNVYRKCEPFQQYDILINQGRIMWHRSKPFYVPNIKRYKIINDAYIMEEIQNSINHIHKTLLIEL